MSESGAQATFPILNGDGKVVGVVASRALHIVAAEEGMADWIVAGDVMQQAVTAVFDEPAVDALSRMVAAGLRQLPVIDEAGAIVAYVDEGAIASKLVQSLPPSAPDSATATPMVRGDGGEG